MLRINFIGCGKLGSTLANLFHQHHVAEIAGVLNTTPESSQAAIKFIGQGEVIPTMDTLPPADIIFITTTDETIEKVCHQLAAHHQLTNHPIIVHCSGALSADILHAAKAVGCPTASLHPIRSFANPAELVKSFSGTLCAYEGDDAAKETLTTLFETIGATVFTINRKNKSQYHAALVMANNYTVTLHYQATTNLIASGVDETIANQISSGMIYDAYRNLQTNSHANALTGPIERGDTETIQSHLAALKQDSVANAIYRSLGLGTLPIATLSKDIENEIRRLLAKSSD